MGGQNWPLPPNGSRRFRVKVAAGLWFAATDTIIISFRSGTGGDENDSVVESSELTTGSSGQYQLYIHSFIATPLISELWTVSFYSANSGSNDVQVNNYFTGTKLSRPLLHQTIGTASLPVLPPYVFACRAGAPFC